MASTNKTTPFLPDAYDFPFFAHLRDFYIQNRRRIRQSYHEVSRKFLDFNDPANVTAGLLPPQFEALEMYVFLKEFLGNLPISTLFRDWVGRQGRFAGRGFTGQFDATGQARDLPGEPTSDLLDRIYSYLKAYDRGYSNYVFALAMGTGKTILMAACIFYEFILAERFPKDRKYCHNALILVPDTTVLELFSEIQTLDKARVVPPEYISWLEAAIRFHVLDKAGMTLNVLDHSGFNLIIANTQKITLPRPRRTETGEHLLRRLDQLGIYVYVADHTFGKQLAEAMDAGDGGANRTSGLRLTINELAASLERGQSPIVACYNYASTPYVQGRVLPEVVSTYSLRSAIDNGFLKSVRVNGYASSQAAEFVEQAIGDFIAHNELAVRHEGILPKMAFFAATVDELRHELRPAVERALAQRDIPADSILVDAGDGGLSTNGDQREFRRLDTPESSKQFILLVPTGREGLEGWSCRSLFGVALYRKPRSKLLVLQASMSCLRPIGESPCIGHVYLSDDNLQVLSEELAQNFHLTIDELKKGIRARRVTIHVKSPVEKIKLTRTRTLCHMSEKESPGQVNLHLDEATTEHYHLPLPQHDGLIGHPQPTGTEDGAAARERRVFTRLTLVAEVARYLHRPCRGIDQLLANTVEGIDKILARVSELNELLYDWVIPHLFQELYTAEEVTHHEEHTVELLKEPPQGLFSMNAQSALVVFPHTRRKRSVARAAKSFHLDTYCFESGAKKALFEHLLGDSRVRLVYFTGMHAPGQSDFYFQYIDPESHAIRSYYPDFLLQDTSGKYIIVQVKADNQVDAPVIVAKQTFAEQSAGNITYCLIKSRHAEIGQCEIIWHPENRDVYLRTIVAERP